MCDFVRSSSEEWSFSVRSLSDRRWPVIVVSPGLERMQLCPRSHMLGQPLDFWADRTSAALASECAVKALDEPWADCIVVCRRSDGSRYTAYLRSYKLNANLLVTAQTEVSSHVPDLSKSYYKLLFYLRQALPWPRIDLSVDARELDALATAEGPFSSPSRGHDHSLTPMPQEALRGPFSAQSKDKISSFESGTGSQDETTSPDSSLDKDSWDAASLFSIPDTASCFSLCHCRQCLSQCMSRPVQHQEPQGRLLVLEFRHTSGTSFQQFLLKAPELRECLEPRAVRGGPIIFCTSPEMHRQAKRHVQIKAKALWPRHVVVEEHLVDTLLEAAAAIRATRGRKVNEKCRYFL
jgi:hypothetical protein